MPTYLCKNTGLGLCDKADRGEHIELASYAEPKCPECGSAQMKEVDSRDVQGGNKPGDKPTLLKPAIVAVVAVAIAAALGAAGYFKRCDIPFLKARACAAPMADPGSPDEQKTGVATPTLDGQVAPGKPDAQAASPASAGAGGAAPPALSDEALAKANCQKAVEANQLDRVHICNRANAITLSNSGALSATMGKLAEAEKDYQAALEKDPDFYGVYLNYAALKVRQNKFPEAIEMIDKSVKRGFHMAEYIDKDPVFDRLRSDPVWGQKLNQTMDGVRSQDVDKNVAK